jgi:hypothetical protein
MKKKKDKNLKAIQEINYCIDQWNDSINSKRQQAPRSLDLDAAEWEIRLTQKKKLKKYLYRFGGELLPGHLISLTAPMYEDLKKYCPEALILITDLKYSIQLKFE